MCVVSVGLLCASDVMENSVKGGSSANVRQLVNAMVDVSSGKGQALWICSAGVCVCVFIAWVCFVLGCSVVANLSCIPCFVRQVVRFESVMLRLR